MSNFYPKREDKILDWTASFRNVVSEEYAQLGLTQQQVDKYALVQQRFADALTLASNKGTNTSAAVQAKNTAKRELEVLTRKIVGFIGSRQETSAIDRARLGLARRKRGRPRGSGDTDGVALMQRAGRPKLSIVSIDDEKVRLIVQEENNQGRRRMPVGVESAIIFSCVGAFPLPTDAFSGWACETLTMTMRCEMRFRKDIKPGTRLWLTAIWCGRNTFGQMCAPMYVYRPNAMCEDFAEALPFPDAAVAQAEQVQLAAAA